MSHLSSLFGPVEPPPQQVRVGAWSLCVACSKGKHADHTIPCDCDLEESA